MLYQWRILHCRERLISNPFHGIERRSTFQTLERLLRNSSDSCKEIKRLYGYEGNIAFTDNKDQKVKTCNLSATVETLLGTGHEGTVDGTEERCSFTQVHAICSL